MASVFGVELDTVKSADTLEQAVAAPVGRAPQVEAEQDTAEPSKRGDGAPADAQTVVATVVKAQKENAQPLEIRAGRVEMGES